MSTLNVIAIQKGTFQRIYFDIGENHSRCIALYFHEEKHFIKFECYGIAWYHGNCIVGRLTIRHFVFLSSCTHTVPCRVQLCYALDLISPNLSLF